METAPCWSSRGRTVLQGLAVESHGAASAPSTPWLPGGSPPAAPGSQQAIRSRIHQNVSSCPKQPHKRQAESPGVRPGLSLEEEADLGPPRCPLPQFPHAWGRPAPAAGGAQLGDLVHPWGRGLQPSPAPCPQHPGETRGGSGPRGAHHVQLVQPCRPRQRGRGAIRLPDCQIKRLHFR